jgi:glycerophosphoryl diester phosphodiesterase
MSLDCLFARDGAASAHCLLQVDVMGTTLLPLPQILLQVAAVYHGMLDKSLMQVLKAQQKTVVAWTVDEVGTMTHMLDQAVDGIVTNAPALLRTTIEAALLQCTREL